MIPEPAQPEPIATRRSVPAGVAWAAAAVGYFACACLATWPAVARFGAEIPGELTDPLEHLWIMRWLRSCLLEGRNPLFCPELQVPIGVPLGAFPPLHLQTAIYILLRLVTSNDAAIFGVIWFLGFVGAGLAGFGLARWAVPGVGRGVAWVAGLGLMLCGPMLMHAHGHLETMQVGVVPPFLMAWLRFVDAPDRRRLILAGTMYLVMAAAAPYFAVLAIFPATWYVGWALVVGPDRGRKIGQLAPWLVGFGVVVLPGLALIYAPQVAASWSGYPMARSKRVFDSLGAPPWSTVAPSPYHLLSGTLGINLFLGAGLRDRVTEVSSYLGLVVLFLLALALTRRVAFPRRGYWWSVLGLMIVLSWGSRQDLFGANLSLPAGWIYDIFPPFHLIRVPARFNLFAAAVAVVPVAAGLQAMIGGWRMPAARVVGLALLTALTLADLAMVPFPTAAIPEPPAIYAEIKRIRPDAKILDAPLFDSTQGQTFSSLWGYWQQRAALATSAGYPGIANSRFDAEIAQPSIFATPRFVFDTRSDFPNRDAIPDVHDRAWLEMTVLGCDYAVLHRGARGATIDGDVLADELAGPLREGIVQETPEITVIARDRLRAPSHLVWLTDRGWRPMPAPAREPATRFAALRDARLVVYQPQPGGRVTLTLGAVEAFGAARVIRVVATDRAEMARFEVRPGARTTLRSAPILVGAGLHEWTIRSDGDARPARSAERFDDAANPYSFTLSTVRLEAAGLP